MPRTPSTARSPSQLPSPSRVLPLRGARATLAPLVAACLLAACPSEPPVPDPPGPPEPGAFQAGAARLRMPVPLGIGTAGSSPFGAPSSDSPYAGTFPATTRVHGHPEIKAVAYSRGEGFELILARLDMIGVVGQLRDAVLAELRERTGRDYDDAFILSATHTHSGPGRFIQGDFYSLITDRFFPEHYERVVSAVADTVQAALADLAPAELARVTAFAPEGHDDRRCEDGLDYTNDTTPLLVVKKDDAIESVVISYAIHGTVLGPDDLTLSQDVSGAIEAFVEQRLPDPAVAMLMNSWAADVSPGTPDEAPPNGATALPDGYDKFERVGVYMAGVVADALPTAEYQSAPTVRGHTTRYVIDRPSIGYGFGEFPYAYGGVYCQGGNDCVTIETIPGMDSACVPFPEESPAPMQSMVTVGALAGAHFLTWGGECGTKLAERTMDEARALPGVQDLIFFGYANDYMGYALEESDWWYGGYEASGSMWGPRQGEHMADRAGRAMRRFVTGEELGFTEPAPVALFDTSAATTVPLETALQAGVIALQPTSVAADGVVTATVNGEDPWLGAPTATLQRDDGVWADLLVGPTRVHSDGYGMWVDLVPDPPYSDDDALPLTRTFAWTFSLPATSRFLSLEAGASYRFRIVVPTPAGGTTEVLTEPFGLL